MLDTGASAIYTSWEKQKKICDVPTAANCRASDYAYGSFQGKDGCWWDAKNSKCIIRQDKPPTDFDLLLFFSVLTAGHFMSHYYVDGIVAQCDHDHGFLVCVGRCLKPNNHCVGTEGCLKNVWGSRSNYDEIAFDDIKSTSKTAYNMVGKSYISYQTVECLAGMPCAKLGCRSGKAITEGPFDQRSDMDYWIIPHENKLIAVETVDLGGEYFACLCASAKEDECMSDVWGSRKAYDRITYGEIKQIERKFPAPIQYITCKSESDPCHALLNCKVEQDD